MIVIVDANVVISSLAAKGVTYKVFFWNSLLDRYEFVAPGFLWKEVNKHKERLLKVSKLSEDEFEEVFEFLRYEIDIVPDNEFLAFLPVAEKVCPDVKDKVYFALALALSSPLFSGDPELKDQSAVKVYNPRELLDILLGRAAP